MRMIENITFKSSIEGKNFLSIINGVNCESHVGKLKEQKSQILSLSTSNCMSKSIIAHELVHALGFDHEHNRPDRDDWVKIDFSNIGTTSHNDFRKLERTEFQDLGSPYDYNSIMHYHSHAHALNNELVTIRAIKPPFEIKMNEDLSVIDVEEIRKLYNCKAGAFTIILFIKK